DGPVPCDARSRHPPHGHLLRRRALPLHHGRRPDHGVPRRPALLLAEDDGTHVSRVAGKSFGGARVRRVQPDLRSAVHPWIHGHAAPVPRVPRRVPGAERRLDAWRDNSRRRLSAAVHVLAVVPEEGRRRAGKSVGREGAGVGAHAVAPATLHLRERPRHRDETRLQLPSRRTGAPWLRRLPAWPHTRTPRRRSGLASITIRICSTTSTTWTSSSRHRSS